MNKSSGARQKNFNEDRPTCILSAAKCIGLDRSF